MLQEEWGVPGLMRFSTYIPIYQSALLAHLSSSMSCHVIPAPRLERHLQGKAGSGILNFALAVSSFLCKAFRTLIA